MSSLARNIRGRRNFVKPGAKNAGAIMLQALLGVILGLVLTMVMVVCFLTAALMLLAAAIFIVGGVGRFLFSRSPGRLADS